MKESTFSSAIRLIEDALVLVKRADSTAWLVYLCGVVPFFGVLVFELTDLTQNPFATEQIVGVSFVLTVLYFWLHLCQAVFSLRLYDAMTEQTSTLGNQFRMATPVQMILAGTKLVVWPIAFCLFIPHPRVTLFYQHLLLPSENVKPTDWRSTFAEASQDARYLPGQAIWFLAIVLLLRAILALNLVTLLLFLPQLWKILTGIESDITRRPALLENPTAFGAICILAYLGLDPIIKAACILRRFERQSARSGSDLLLRLRGWQRSAASLMILGVLCFSSRLIANSDSTQVTPDQMKQAIHNVFHDPSNTWDLPVVDTSKHNQNPVFAFIDSVTDHVDKIWKDLREWLNRLFKNDSEPPPPPPDGTPASSSDGRLLLGVFGCLLGLAVAFAWWRRGKTPAPSPIESAAAVTSVPVDLTSDDIQPDDQPEDEWIKLAQEHRAAGNLRLSLRAFYLSSLATLSSAQLIAVGRGKSNLDYFRELQRRGKRLDPEVITIFRSNLGLFEQSWYGTKPVSDPILDAFESDLRFLRKQIQAASPVTSRKPAVAAAPASPNVSAV